MKRIMLALSIFMLVALAVSCTDNPTSSGTSEPPTGSITGTPVEVAGGTYWKLTPAQFYNLARNSRAYLVNLDSEPQFYIANTKLFLEADLAASNLEKFPSDKSTIVAIYCSIGTKSPDVAAALVQAGYTNVAELTGGWVAWQQHGYSLIPYS